ncbi:hypothetical protein A2773_06790 [Candidatus Gottesmanbacteria bacterium RIFCSPHIGHO2_01_FULL_39_10]|uniref:Uncharacterized protein n=1 Tax=Candidatus Gottesmanbacteria bacterium RIFCSPHIGHO2_01_FULL_39_10 TaxID=1798375 RepID=A0A1F5ZP64_9BACT|nr:MAG: hypothetical protein A2773_06790 [Candidatus Gottesmanbacteria bacterium RIFCSPHIGHO2_01_FULL_39_10]
MPFYPAYLLSSLYVNVPHTTIKAHIYRVWKEIYYKEVRKIVKLWEIEETSLVVLVLFSSFFQTRGYEELTCS